MISVEVRIETLQLGSGLLLFIALATQAGLLSEAAKAVDLKIQHVP